MRAWHVSTKEQQPNPSSVAVCLEDRREINFWQFRPSLSRYPSPNPYNLKCLGIFVASNGFFSGDGSERWSKSTAVPELLFLFKTFITPSLQGGREVLISPIYRRRAEAQKQKTYLCHSKECNARVPKALEVWVGTYWRVQFMQQQSSGPEQSVHANQCGEHSCNCISHFPSRDSGCSCIIPCCSPSAGVSAAEAIADVPQLSSPKVFVKGQGTEVELLKHRVLCPTYLTSLLVWSMAFGQQPPQHPPPVEPKPRRPGLVSSAPGPPTHSKSVPQCTTTSAWSTSTSGLCCREAAWCAVRLTRQQFKAEEDIKPNYAWIHVPKNVKEMQPKWTIQPRKVNVCSFVYQTIVQGNSQFPLGIYNE